MIGNGIVMIMIINIKRMLDYTSEAAAIAAAAKALTARALAAAPRSLSSFVTFMHAKMHRV